MPLPQVVQTSWVKFSLVGCRWLENCGDSALCGHILQEEHCLWLLDSIHCNSNSGTFGKDTTCFPFCSQLTSFWAVLFLVVECLLLSPLSFRPSIPVGSLADYRDYNHQGGFPSTVASMPGNKWELIVPFDSLHIHARANKALAIKQQSCLSVNKLV